MSTVPFITKYNSKYSLDNILQEICDIYEVSPLMVKSKSQKEIYVKARRMFCFAVCEMTNYPLKEIGRAVGNIDHTSVIYHRDTAKRFYKNGDAKFMEDYEKYSSQSKIWSKYLSE